MTRLALMIVATLLVCAPAGATFEMDDPMQQLDELREAQEAENAKARSSSLVVLEKRDYLKMIVANYVHGFKEFDTTVRSSGELVEVGIYYRPDDQDKDRAEQLSNRFRKELPLILEDPVYQWAKDVAVEVSVRSSPVPGLDN